MNLSYYDGASSFFFQKRFFKNWFGPWLFLLLIDFWQFVLGDYQWTSYSELDARSSSFGAGLVAFGQSPRQNIVILAETRAEWLVAAYGCMKYNIPSTFKLRKFLLTLHFKICFKFEKPWVDEEFACQIVYYNLWWIQKWNKNRLWFWNWLGNFKACCLENSLSKIIFIRSQIWIVFENPDLLETW